MSAAFRTNPRAAWLIVAAITALALTSILSACGIQDIVKIDVPTGIQTAIDLEPRISVSESGAAWDEWVAWVDRNSTRFSGEIDEGQATAGLIASLTDTGLALGKDAASTLPGGAFISTGLALMGGLFLKRPGDKAKEKQEAEKSYTAGLQKGREIATTVAQGLESLRGSQQAEKS